LRKYKSSFDLSVVNLDGSHSSRIRGGEEVGYQGRKKRKTTNALYLTDKQGLVLVMGLWSGGGFETHLPERLPI
jgi:hypothetical protein